MKEDFLLIDSPGTHELTYVLIPMISTAKYSEMFKTLTVTLVGGTTATIEGEAAKECWTRIIKYANDESW